MHKIALRTFWGLASIALIAAATMSFMLYKDIRAEGQKNPSTPEDVARNKVHIVQAVADSGVDYLDANKGFWYLSQDGTLFQYDPDRYAQEGLTDAQLAALVGDIQHSTRYATDAMRVVKEHDLPPVLQFHNALYAPGGVGNTYTLIAALEQKVLHGSYTQENLEQLAYAYEQVGRYNDRDRTHALLCNKFSVSCTSATTATIKGVVRDFQGDAIAGAAVEIISRPGSKTVHTDIKGQYTLSVSISGLEKLRIKASKRNFSDGVTNLQIVTTGRTAYTTEDIVLTSPIGIVSIDTKNHTISGENNTILADGTYVVKTAQSEYHIPKDAIRHRDGTLYQGLADVYLYEFTKDTVPESLVAVDTFDEVMGYAGDLMKTFGMPYIQFFTQDGEELHVFSSNPMTLTYRIYHMQALYNASDHIYPPLTDADMQLLQDVSAGGGYPINREFLIKSGLLRFPAFWVFDQVRGIWDNVGVDVVDKSGIIRSIFYTIKVN